MLKSGVFVSPKGAYDIYEITTGNYYRIDFMKPGSPFQVNPDAVIFSMVRRRNTFTYGDQSIYDEYMRMTEVISSAQMKSTKESSWKDGAYVVEINSVNEKLGYRTQTISKNGNVVDTTLIGNGYTISTSVFDPLYDVKIDPINFAEYHLVQISSDSVGDSEAGLFHSLEYLKRRYDLRHIEKKDYVVATDLMTAYKRLEEFDNNPYPFRAFDTETTGTDVCMYGDDHLVGVILGSDPNTATYFPFRHDGDFNLPMSFLDDLMKVLLKHEEHSVAHNKKFDRQVMLKEGYDIRIKWDTMQISIILNPILGKGIHGEKQLTQELTGLHFLELDEIFVNAADINFAKLPVDIIKYYACPDGTNPLLLLDDMLHKLPKFQYRLAELECDLADVKADMEYYGIRVDIKKFEKQYRNCTYILDMLLNAFRTLTHEDGNINSAPVLTNLLYNKMHCPVLLRTPSGLPSTSMIAVKKLAKKKATQPWNITEDLVDLQGKTVIKASDLANSAYPALLILSKYKEYNKLMTAFYARFERTMKTGRVFFWVNQNGAATGRQSSPMHQLPPDLKDVILADADDRDFWGPDYSQIELRMIAYLAGETELIELAKDPDNDIHRIIGSLISGKPMWAITPEERSKGKRRNFGVVYLISKYGLAGQLVGPGYTAEDVAFAEQQLNDFYHRFKRIDRYIKRNAALVQKRGYMETKWLHRRRLFPQIFDPNIEPSTKASILRMGNNVPVQGTSADYIKIAEVQMSTYIRQKGWNKIVDGFPMVRIMLSIHDELIISAHNSIPYEEIIEMITKCMETPVDDAPPFFAQPARMDNWGGHSDDAVVMPIRYRDKVLEDYAKTGVSVFHQSYFTISIPDDIKTILNTSKKPTSELVTEYVDKCTLVFDHGNYTKEFTIEHVKDALKRYIDSGFTTYRIDDYITNLNNFRQLQLHDYMQGLINEYGTDYKAVGEHVRHPSLTFDLLDTYSGKIPKDMEHVDAITEAARLYIEDLGTDALSKMSEFKADLSSTAKATDKDLYSEQLEQLVELDANGDVVFSEEEDMSSPYEAFYDFEVDDVIDRCNNKPVYVWELADCVCIDTAELDDNGVNKMLSYVFEHKRDDGFYRVVLCHKGQLLDTHMRMEQVNTEEMNNCVISLSREVDYAFGN